MNSLLRGIGGGFGRVLGRFFAFIFILVVIYFVINFLGIDIKSILPKIKGLIL